MGGVREGEKTSHHAEQDRPNRFPCGAGRSDQKVASSVGLWLEAAPLRPPPASRRVWAEDPGSAPSQRWSEGTNGLSGGVRGCAQGLAAHWGAAEIRAYYALLCFTTHWALLWHSSMLLGFWAETFTRSHTQNVFLKWLCYQQDNGWAKHGEDSTAWFSAWWVRKG